MEIERGRQAYARREWKEAYGQLSAADADTPLEAVDLERLAQAAYLVGRDADAKTLFQRAHHRFIDAGQPERAARWGFWLGLVALLGGDVAQANGWLARMQRLVGDRPESAEHVYVRMLSALAQMRQGDAQGACAGFEQVIALADRFDDRDLSAFGLLGLGQALIELRLTAEGMTRLDEAMIAVATGEVSPMAAGMVYCAVILACQRVFDLRRCREWTQALNEWCATQPDLVPYRGECLVHRSEILRLQGEWPDAMAEARRAIESCRGRAGSWAGRAYYQCAEIHRLRGDYGPAEDMYREAGRHGTEPQPGLSLLRLAQGDVDAARAAIHRVVGEPGRRPEPVAAMSRPGVLRACVEIMIAADAIEPAKAAADELEELVAGSDAPFLRASSAEATGAVLLAQGDAPAALAALREAWMAWQHLDAPYESACVRVRIGHACRSLGDAETARSHHEAAARAFERLGAAPALRELGARDQKRHAASAFQLSGRELQVLGLLAKGQTNREIAARLFISEHTVAGHLGSIFGKLQVTSRTAAAAIAFEHGLLQGEETVNFDHPARASKR